MHRYAFLMTLVAVLMVAWPAQSARANQDEADPVQKRLEESPRHHEWVDIKAAGGRTVRAFVVYPQVKDPVAAVVVIHENRGLNDWARSVADQLAEAGYVAIAPDMLSQTGPGGGGTESFASTDAARTGIYELPDEQVLTDLDAAVAYARTLDANNGTVAVGGFCWGGGQTFRYATHNPDIAAAYVFYGTAPEDAEVFKSIKAPVHGFYGGNDRRITGQVPRVTEQMKQAGKAYEPVTYDEAGHGFMRGGEAPDASPANRKAMTDAWARWKLLLEKL